MSWAETPQTGVPRSRIVTLKITLAEIEPPIWRRIEAPADLTLHGLHSCLQRAFGWYNCHLHEFDIGGFFLTPSNPELEGDFMDSRRSRYLFGCNSRQGVELVADQAASFSSERMAA